MSNNPKDRPAAMGPEVKPVWAPAGLDLRPTPRTSIRISKRAGFAIGAVALGLLSLFAYGGYRRQLRSQVQAREASLPTGVGPATASAREVEKDVPIGNASLVHGAPNELQPPIDGNPMAATGSAQSVPNASCGLDPRSGSPYRFSPETGQPCSSAQDRVVVRQPPYSATQPPPVVPAPEPTPEEHRIAAAYQREQEAMSAPTSIRSEGGPTGLGSLNAGNASYSSGNDLAQIAALTQAIAGQNPSGAAPVNLGRPVSLTGNPSHNDSDYDGQNMQVAKAAFVASSGQQKANDYLQSMRTAPLSVYEIKTGWEIPAVLEQSLNSDLPGDIKALVTSDVFDTASGQYLLIPQGSRLVGKYDSRVAYGQDGVQVVWDRIIFPDASSIDINGMVGLDSHGISGLRYDVDHHYKRLFGFGALTSAFSAAFDLSQRNTQSALTTPSVSNTATASVGRDMSETGAQITRRNLDVQPTIKVPVGYKFTVRVNRDIVFDAPYEPIRANPLPVQPPGQLQKRIGFSITGYIPK